MTARVLVQFTTVLKGRGPPRLQRERDGKAATERKAKGKEAGLSSVCVCDSIQAPGCPLDLEHVGVL